MIALDVASTSESELRQEVLDLRERRERLLVILRLVVVLEKVSESSLRRRRVPDGEKKRLILRAVGRSREVLTLRSALLILGLSKTRYHDWKREAECELEDAYSCPQSHPQQLTAEEREVMTDMVTSERYRHVSTGTLAVFAQRLDQVFASPSTWHRLVRKNGWRRPRKRVHPAKPKLGVRASGSNEIWHVDTSAVRLLDGTRVYLYAVIDNFSRTILAWRVSENFDPTNTLAILLEAAGGVDRSGDPPTSLADSGLENRTKAIDELVDSGVLRLGAFYIQEHNTRLPHSAFRGQTPDEMYFGPWERRDRTG